MKIPMTSENEAAVIELAERLGSAEALVDVIPVLDRSVRLYLLPYALDASDPAIRARLLRILSADFGPPEHEALIFEAWSSALRIKPSHVRRAELIAIGGQVSDALAARLVEKALAPKRFQDLAQPTAFTASQFERVIDVIEGVAAVLSNDQRLAMAEALRAGATSANANERGRVTRRLATTATQEARDAIARMAVDIARLSTDARPEELLATSALLKPQVRSAVAREAFV